jgi:hypothetical protein
MTAAEQIPNGSAFGKIADRLPLAARRATEPRTDRRPNDLAAMIGMRANDLHAENA